MRILFVHQNFPGQFKHLAPAVAACPEHEVVAFAMNDFPDRPDFRVVRYRPGRGSSQDMHPWGVEFETKLIRGEAAFRAALALRKQGFAPDIVVAHPGWGESLFLKEVWPDAKLRIYCEFFYHSSGVDVGFDPEFPPPNEDHACYVRAKNANYLMHLDIAETGLAPTHWQKSVFPEMFRSKIAVVHDGIDTDAVAPAQDVHISFGNTLKLTRSDEIVTFVNRNLEPYRGYHIFMRALPEILRTRPKAHILLVGGDDVSYGPRSPDGKTWKERFLREVADRVDTNRIHFLGRIPYGHYLAILQLSSVHVYLTYPFVLSWSLLESMSVGCAIVASDTQPVREAIAHGETGRLIDFFDHRQLADEVCRLLADPDERARLGMQARAFARAHYDLKTVCLPAQLAWALQGGD